MCSAHPRSVVHQSSFPGRRNTDTSDPFQSLGQLFCQIGVVAASDFLLLNKSFLPITQFGQAYAIFQEPVYLFLDGSVYLRHILRIGNGEDHEPGIMILGFS